MRSLQPQPTLIKARRRLAQDASTNHIELATISALTYQSQWGHAHVPKRSSRRSWGGKAWQNYIARSFLTGAFWGSDGLAKAIKLAEAIFNDSYAGIIYKANQVDGRILNGLFLRMKFSFRPIQHYNHQICNSVTIISYLGSTNTYDLKSGNHTPPQALNKLRN